MSPDLRNTKNLKNTKHTVSESCNENRKGFQSSFPGVIYSGERGAPFPNIFDWLQGKKM